jgi:hypothetical protein
MSSAVRSMTSDEEAGDWAFAVAEKAVKTAKIVKIVFIIA